MLNREKNSHAKQADSSVLFFSRNCQGAMKCFTAAIITLWLAAAISQIHAEVSLLSRLAPMKSNADDGLISNSEFFSLDVIGF